MGPSPAPPTPARAPWPSPPPWNHDAVLLANHGVLTVGADLEQAYWRMETVEHTAQIHLNARLLGGGVALSAQEVEELQK